MRKNKKIGCQRYCNREKLLMRLLFFESSLLYNNKRCAHTHTHIHTYTHAYAPTHNNILLINNLIFFYFMIKSNIN